MGQDSWPGTAVRDLNHRSRGLLGTANRKPTTKETTKEPTLSLPRFCWSKPPTTPITKHQLGKIRLVFVWLANLSVFFVGQRQDTQGTHTSDLSGSGSDLSGDRARCPSTALRRPPFSRTLGGIRRCASSSACLASKERRQRSRPVGGFLVFGFA